MARKPPPIWARFAVNATKRTCLLSLAVPVLCIVVIYAFKLFKLSEMSSNEYIVKNNPLSEYFHARDVLREEYPFESRQATPLTERSGSRTILILFRNTLPASVRNGNNRSFAAEPFDNTRKLPNLLTPQGMAFLKKAEDGVTNSPQYSQFCQRPPNGTRDCDGNLLKCIPPLSITSHPALYGIWNLTATPPLPCGRKNSSAPVSKQAFDIFMNNLFVNGSANPNFSVFFTRDFNASSRSTQSVRSFLYMGNPIENTTDAKTDEAKVKLYQEWASKINKDVEGRNTAKFHVFLFSSERISAAFGPVVMRDLTFAGASIALVFIVIWLHTTSSYLASTAMLQVLLAFPLTFLVYRLVFQIQYFASLQIMTIFLILGIGADDVFVFTDAWRQAPVTLGPDVPLVDRMGWTYKRAVKAMSVTSFTTAVAFFCTATSPIMPISTVGIWAGLLVLLQFALVITVYPSAIIIWHRFWRVRRWYRCFRLHDSDDTSQERSTPTNGSGNGNSGVDDVFNRDAVLEDSGVGAAFERPSGDVEPQVQPTRTWRQRFFSHKEGELRPIERMFNGPWTRITHLLRIPLTVVAVILMGLSIWLATRLETPTEREQFLPDTDPILKASRLLAEGFPAFEDNVQNVQLKVGWGLKGIDRSGTNKYNPEDLGKAILDPDFDMKSLAAQQRMLDACSYFANNTLGLITNSSTIKEKVECWPEDFLRWRLAVKKKGFISYADDISLVEDLKDFGQFVKNGTIERPYRKYLRDQRIIFNKERTKVLYSEITFIGKTKLAQPYQITWPAYERWAAAIAQFNMNTTDAGVKNAGVTGGGSWVWAVTQKALVDNMLLGIGVVLAVAMVSLTVSTGNIIVAFLALASIAGILTNVLGFIYLLGWKLGIIESIAVVISIGFSFDYVAHVANAYIESDRSLGRFERTQHALTDLGISVIAGAVSTLLSGSMLFFATIIFFVKFAGFIVMTVSLALIWGLIFFPAFLHLVGPEGNTGEIWAAVKKCCGKQDNDRNTDDEPGNERDVQPANQQRESDDAVGVYQV